MEARIVGSDAADLDWGELSPLQKEQADKLGYTSGEVWNSGALPGILQDDKDGSKKDWILLSEVQRDAAIELGYNEKSWNQKDTLDVMHNTALRNTFGWLQQRSHIHTSIADATEFEGAREILEFTLLRFARTALADHDSTSAAIDAVKSQSSGDSSLGTRSIFAECWIEENTVTETHKRMQKHLHKQCEKRTSAKRFIIPATDDSDGKDGATDKTGRFGLFKRGTVEQSNVADGDDGGDDDEDEDKAEQALLARAGVKNAKKAKSRDEWRVIARALSEERIGRGGFDPVRCLFSICLFPALTIVLPCAGVRHFGRPDVLSGSKIPRGCTCSR